MPFAINDVVYKRKEFLAALGVKPELIPSQGVLQFEKCGDNGSVKSLVVKNDPNEVIAMARQYPRIAMQPKFTVRNSDGDLLEIRYFNTQIRVKGELKYSPTYLEYQDNVFTIPDADEFLWFYLNPRNSDSPLRKIGEAYDFHFINPQKIAANKNQNMDQIVKSLSLVYGEHAIDYSAKCQLLKALGQSNVESLSSDEVDSILGTLAQKNPLEFYNKAKSNTTRFTGVIRDALDKNIITKVDLYNLVIYKLNDKEIFSVSKDMDGFDAISDFISNNMDQYYPIILSSLDAYGKKNKLNSPELQKYFPEIGMSNVRLADVDNVIKEKAESGLVGIKHQEFLEEFSKYDPNDPKLSATTKKQYMKFKDEIEAYKLKNEYINS